MHFPHIAFHRQPEAQEPPMHEIITSALSMVTATDQQPAVPARVSTGAVVTKAPLNRLNIRSMVDAKAEVHGSIECQETLMVDGIIDGDVRVSGTGRLLLIRKGAVVRGAAHAQTVLCAGTVEGGIHANAVHLFRTATVRGPVTARSIGLDEGCSLHSDSVECGDLATAEAPKSAATAPAAATIDSTVASFNRARTA